MNMHSNQRRSGGGQDRRPEPHSLSLSRDYLETMRSGYFDADNTLKGVLITTLAERVAKDFVDGGKITTGQLRNFFGHVRGLQRELDQSDFAVVKPKILQLKPLAAVYVGRGGNSEKGQRTLLKQFIDANVEQAQKGKREFKEGFVAHFQSVVAYYKYHQGVKGG